MRKKWDDLKLFIEYGMLSDEKFHERAEKFVLLKNVEGKYFTLEEYEKLIKENQTDKNKSLVYLYATDKAEQYSYIEAAKAKGYDVLLMDGQLDTHFLNHLETETEGVTGLPGLIRKLSISSLTRMRPGNPSLLLSSRPT